MEFSLMKKWLSTLQKNNNIKLQLKTQINIDKFPVHYHYQNLKWL